MTYVPVRDEDRKAHGRNPLDIPEALLAQLRHSRATGDRYEIELTPEDSPEEIADLKRALVRAGYRHFPDHSIYKRIRPDRITYWVGAKKAKGQRQKEDDAE